MFNKDKFFKEFGESRYGYCGDVYEVVAVKHSNAILQSLNDDHYIRIPLSRWTSFHNNFEIITTNIYKGRII